MEEAVSVLALEVPEAEAVISQVRTSLGIERVPLGIPAHISLVFPWMPPEQISEAVLDELAALFMPLAPFVTKLELGWFGNSVLLLVPDDPAPFVALTLRVIQRWPEYPYYGGDYERIEPHLTLAYGSEEELRPLVKGLNQLPVVAGIHEVALSVGSVGKMTVRRRFGFSAGTV